MTKFGEPKSGDPPETGQQNSNFLTTQAIDK